jgi:hypothetical protein
MVNEETVADFKLLLLPSSGKTEANHEYFRQDGWYLGRDSISLIVNAASTLSIAPLS